MELLFWYFVVGCVLVLLFLPAPEKLGFKITVLGFLYLVTIWPYLVFSIIALYRGKKKI